MDALAAAGIFVLGILQGFLNTVAGGGSLIVLPALTFVGLDIAAANGTNRVAVLLQCMAGAASFRKDGILRFRAALPPAVAATVGAAIGSLVAIRLDRQILSLCVAAIICVLAVLLVAKPDMWETQRASRWPKWAEAALFVGIGFYGGFIQAGVGFFLSWGLCAASGHDLVRGNGVKTVIVGMYTVVSLALFFANGLVHVGIGLVLAAGSMIGAVFGARFTVAKGNRWVRRILAVTVVVSAAKMVLDAFAG